MTTTVKTQKQLDAAIKAGETDIIIDSPEGVWLYLMSRESAHVEARESAHVVAWGSSHVEARGSAHVEARESAHVVAWGSAHVVAWGSSHVEARGSAHVEAWGSAHVEARESSHVVAWGSAHVVARESAHVEARGSSHVVAWGSAHVEASKYVAVHLHSQHVQLAGGTVIDMTAVDQHDLADWLDLTGVHVEDGHVVLYKAVDADLRASHDSYHYPIGETLTDPDWRDDHECGGGLHLSPTPQQAKSYFNSATRFLACRVAVEDLRCIDASKVKARTVTVLHEVGYWDRKPLAVAEND